MEPQKILSTKDYSIFKNVTSNREVSQSHVKSLVKAIRKKNLLPINPIIVSSKFEVIDGQHRLEVAKLLDLEIFYTVSDNITHDDISVLNTNKKNWSLTDYLNFWAIEKKEEYIKVTNFLNKFPLFPLTVAVQILADLGSHGGLLPAFREGTYRVISFEDGCKFAEAVKKLHEHGAFVYHSSFVRAFMTVFSNDAFVLESLIKGIEKQPRSFCRCVGEKQYLEMLEEIYNHGRHYKLRFK